MRLESEDVEMEGKDQIETIGACCRRRLGPSNCTSFSTALPVGNMDWGPLISRCTGYLLLHHSIPIDKSFFDLGELVEVVMESNISSPKTNVTAQYQVTAFAVV